MSSNFLPSFLRSFSFPFPRSLKMPDADVFRLVSLSFPHMNLSAIHPDTIVILAICLVSCMGFAFVGCILFFDALDAANEEKEAEKVVKTAYADHPLVKLTVDALVEKNVPFGFIRQEDTTTFFYELKNVALDGSVLSCFYKGKPTPVSLVLTHEKNLRRPRWLNHVYVSVPINTEIRHMLLKDYVALKYDLVFT